MLTSQAASVRTAQATCARLVLFAVRASQRVRGGAGFERAFAMPQATISKAT